MQEIAIRDGADRPGDRHFEYDPRGDATWTTTWASGAGTTAEPVDPGTGTSRTVYRALDGRGREAVIAWTGAPSDLTRVEREYGPLVARETRGSGNATVAYAYDDPRLLLTGIKPTSPRLRPRLTGEGHETGGARPPIQPGPPTPTVTYVPRASG